MILPRESSGTEVGLESPPGVTYLPDEGLIKGVPYDFSEAANRSWRHYVGRDEKDADKNLSGALGRAENGSWETGERANSDLRLLMMDTVIAGPALAHNPAAALIHKALASASGHPYRVPPVSPGDFATVQRRATYELLARTWIVFEETTPRSRDELPNEVITIGGVPGYEGDTRSPVHGIIAVGLAVIATGVLTYYLAAKTADLVFAISKDSADERELIRQQARATKLYQDHLDKERIAGHDLPLSENEHAQLINLEKIQGKVLEAKTGRKLPSLIPDLSNQGPNIIKAAQETTTSLGTYVILGAVAVAGIVIVGPMLMRGKAA